MSLDSRRALGTDTHKKKSCDDLGFQRTLPDSMSTNKKSWESSANKCQSKESQAKEAVRTKAIVGTNEKPREEKINNPLCVALNTILCGQEPGGFVKCIYVCMCVNPHTNAAEGGWKRAETAAERLMKFLPKCVCLKECR